MGHHTKIKLISRQAGLRLKSRSRHIRNTLRRMSRWRCAVITGSCVRILLEKDKVGDLNNCALHLRNLWRRWHKGSSYQSSVLLIFVERHVRSFEDDMICFMFFRLWGSKRNLDSTISTSESMCFGESRKCPSALWAYIESGIWFWLSGKDLRKPVVCLLPGGFEDHWLGIYAWERWSYWTYGLWDGRRLRPFWVL